MTPDAKGNIKGISVPEVPWLKEATEDQTVNVTGRRIRLFWDKVRMTHTCWLWMASTDKDGYGWFRDGKVNIRAHRWAYQRAVGDVPSGLVLDHLCANPRCVNPEHLEAVTPQVNARRAGNRQEDVCHNGHTLEGDNVQWDRGKRVCRKCAVARRRRHYRSSRGWAS